MIGDIQKLIEAEKEKNQPASDSTNGDSTNGRGNGEEGKFHEK